MDSLTQIVLGASMGEAIAGKKLGNRAMLWGGIAGTIPDLDVFAGFFGMSEIDSLAFHRAISHSLLFAVVAPLLLSFFTRWYYSNEKHYNHKGKRIIVAILGILFMLFCGLIINAIPYVFSGGLSYLALMISLVLFFFFSRRLLKNYIPRKEIVDNLSLPHWYLFFFVCIVTHPLLDCCTGYGTQLFQPFSDMRVAWHNISVADPIYTFGYLGFLIAAACLRKEHRWRSILNYCGIIWGLLYMAWTVRNKIFVNDVMEENIQKSEIQAERYLTTPTIFNNVLWNCVAETDSAYYTGNYSLNDSNRNIGLNEIPKNWNLIEYKDDYAFKKLVWFSDGFYNVIRKNQDTLQFNDLRYGTYIGGDWRNPKDYIFSFLLVTKPDGTYDFHENNQRPDEASQKKMLRIMWNRIIGKM